MLRQVSSHRWSGFLAFKEGNWKRIGPVTSPADDDPSGTATCTQTAGVRYIEKRGLASIAEKAEEQTLFLIWELKKETNIIVYNEHPDLPIVAFNIQGLQNDDMGFMLARAYGIIARTGLHCAPLVHQAIDGGVGCVRLSLS